MRVGVDIDEDAGCRDGSCVTLVPLGFLVPAAPDV